MRVAFIPARGTSRRFPGKNLALFRGTPLVVWAVLVGLEARAGLVDRVVVSTDVPAVAEAVDLYGVEVAWRVDRPDETVVDVLRAWLPAQVETVCVLLPTSPLRRLAHLVESRALLDGADVVMSVTPFRQSVDHVVVMAPMSPDPVAQVELSLAPSMACRHDGTVAWFRADHLRAGGGYYDGRLRGLLVPPEDSVDVDTPLDLAYAEWLASRRDRHARD